MYRQVRHERDGKMVKGKHEDKPRTCMWDSSKRGDSTKKRGPMRAQWKKKVPNRRSIVRVTGQRLESRLGLAHERTTREKRCDTAAGC